MSSIDPNFYQQAYQQATGAYQWGQGVYEDQSRALHRSQREMEYWQTNLGTEEQEFSPWMGQFEFGKTPGKKFFAELGLDKSEFKTKEQRDALMQDMYGAQVEEANSLMSQSLEAARGGDKARADELKAQADALMEGAPMMGTKGRLGKEKATGRGIMMTGGGVSSQLQSPGAMIIGGNLQRAEALGDETSEEYQSMRESLVGGAEAELDAAQVTAGRALATGERAAVAGLRQQKLMTGSAVNPAAQAAQQAQVAADFAGRRATTLTMIGAERAKVNFEADKFMNMYIPEFQNNAVAAASAFVKDRAFINDTYLQLQTSLSQTAMQMAGQVSSSMTGLAGQAYSEALRAETASSELAASEETDWVSLGVTAVATIATIWAGGVGGAVAAGATAAAGAGAAAGAKAGQ
jgi:hypothetical protein